LRQDLTHGREMDTLLPKDNITVVWVQVMP